MAVWSLQIMERVDKSVFVGITGHCSAPGETYTWICVVLRKEMKDTKRKKIP